MTAFICRLEVLLSIHYYCKLHIVWPIWGNFPVIKVHYCFIECPSCCRESPELRHIVYLEEEISLKILNAY